MLVVSFHSGVLIRDRFPELGDSFLLNSGAGGVDIFFPISGFVMLVSSQALANQFDGWKVFLERRIIRIVPLYWSATTLKLLMVFALPSLALHTRIVPWHTIASYLFIPAENFEGKVEPIVPVGWTLDFEMFFYGIFALALFWRRSLFPAVTTFLLLAVAVGAIVPAATPITILHPLVLEFGAGVWIAHRDLTGRRSAPGTAALFFIVGLTALVSTSWLSSDFVNRWRLLLWGIPGALVVSAAVSLEPWVARRKWRLGRSLGDASYSIYLSHGFVLPVLGILAVKAGLHSMAGAIVTFGLAVVVSGAVGVLVHRFFERPITRLLLLWSKSRRVALAVAAE